MVFCEGRALLGTSFVSLGWRAVIDRDRLVVLHDDVMVCAHGADGFDKVTWDHGGEAHLLERGSCQLTMLLSHATVVV